MPEGDTVAIIEQHWNLWCEPPSVHHGAVGTAQVGKRQALSIEHQPGVPPRHLRVVGKDQVILCATPECERAGWHRAAGTVTLTDQERP
jgi:hypothetical protein